MKLSELKEILTRVEHLEFIVENGKQVPSHFHLTEMGSTLKNFIDCGGTIRNEKKVTFQFWEATDYNHRLLPSKLLKIILMSEEKLGLSNEEIEVEYQSETIGKYGIEFNAKNFILTTTHTACLASDSCEKKQSISLKSLASGLKENACCNNVGACC